MGKRFKRRTYMATGLALLFAFVIYITRFDALDFMEDVGCPSPPLGSEVEHQRYGGLFAKFMYARISLPEGGGRLYSAHFIKRGRPIQEGEGGVIILTSGDAGRYLERMAMEVELSETIERVVVSPSGNSFPGEWFVPHTIVEGHYCRTEIPGGPESYSVFIDFRNDVLYFHWHYS